MPKKEFHEDSTHSKVRIEENEKPEGLFSFKKVRSFFNRAGDREGGLYLPRLSGRTTLSRYTDLEISPDSPKPRLLHNGHLSHDEKEQIRENVRGGREKVDQAITFLGSEVSELRKDPQKCALLARHFGIRPEDIISGRADQRLIQISHNMKLVADGLYSPNLEMKLTDSLTDDPGRAGFWKRAPHRNMEGRARPGSYRDDDPGTHLRFTKKGISNPDRGAETLVKASAVNSANLSDREAASYAAFARDLYNVSLEDRYNALPSENYMHSRYPASILGRSSQESITSLDSSQEDNNFHNDIDKVSEVSGNYERLYYSGKITLDEYSKMSGDSDLVRLQKNGAKIMLGEGEVTNEEFEEMNRIIDGNIDKKEEDGRIYRNLDTRNRDFRR